MIVKRIQVEKRVIAVNGQLANAVPTNWQCIGRPGLLGRSRIRQRSEFDARFGVGGWRIRHRIAGEILNLAMAAGFLEQAYELQLLRHPSVLDALVQTAAQIYENAHSNIRSGQDYSIQERRDVHVFDIAIRRALGKLGVELRGEDLVRIAGRGCQCSHLDPAIVRFHRPELIEPPAIQGWWQPDSLQAFWRSSKVLEVKTAQVLDQGV